MKRVPLPDNYYFLLIVRDLGFKWEFVLLLKKGSKYYTSNEVDRKEYETTEQVVDTDALLAKLMTGMEELVADNGLDLDREKELKRLQKFVNDFNSVQGFESRRDYSDTEYEKKENRYGFFSRLFG